MTPWTVTHQALLPVGFPSQEYWSGSPFPFPWKSSSSRGWTCVSCIAGRFFTAEPPWKACHCVTTEHAHTRTPAIPSVSQNNGRYFKKSVLSLLCFFISCCEIPQSTGSDHIKIVIRAGNKLTLCIVSSLQKSCQTAFKDLNIRMPNTIA